MIAVLGFGAFVATVLLGVASIGLDRMYAGPQEPKSVLLLRSGSAGCFLLMVGAIVAASISGS